MYTFGEVIAAGTTMLCAVGMAMEGGVLTDRWGVGAYESPVPMDRAEKHLAESCRMRAAVGGYPYGYWGVGW